MGQEKRHDEEAFTSGWTTLKARLIADIEHDIALDVAWGRDPSPAAVARFKELVDERARAYGFHAVFAEECEEPSEGDTPSTGSH